MKPIDIALIQARRKKIDAEIAAENARFQKELEDHESRLTVLAREQHDLEVAERVFARLTNEAAPPDKKHSGRTSAAVADGKPDGIPPVPEMIKEALTHAEELGRPGLRPAEILSYIQGKWWPTAHTTDVGPIAWRMWQRDDLIKYKDGTYALPEEEIEEKDVEEEGESAA
jgi:hypothetical protein